MKHRILLAVGIGLTIIADVAVLLMAYGWLERSGWIAGASFTAALVMFIWAVRAPAAWGAMALLYFFAEALFLPFADFYGFSINDLFFPSLVLPWVLLGTAQFFIVWVRIWLELNAGRRVGEDEADTEPR